VVIGFDDPDSSYRRDTWPGYKATRVDKLGTLVEQLALAVEVLRELGVGVVVPPALEADDVLASTAAHARAQGATTVVVTSDRDAFALIDDTTSVLRIIDGGVDASPMMTPERLVLLMGVRPEQYRDFAALRGDPSDNLPGVRGIGPRTAAKLLAEFGTARAAFEDLAAVRNRLGAGVAARLAAEGAREAFELNCRVMAMRADVPVDCRPLPLDAAAVARVYRSHNLVWTVKDALCALAAADTVDVPGPEPVLPSWVDPAPPRSWARRRLPPLPARPAHAQLALFD
jgi:DNA polymerase-1